MNLQVLNIATIINSMFQVFPSSQNTSRLRLAFRINHYVMFLTLFSYMMQIDYLNRIVLFMLVAYALPTQQNQNTFDSKIICSW